MVENVLKMIKLPAQCCWGDGQAARGGGELRAGAWSRQSGVWAASLLLILTSMTTKLHKHEEIWLKYTVLITHHHHPGIQIQIVGHWIYPGISWLPEKTGPHHRMTFGWLDSWLGLRWSDSRTQTWSAELSSVWPLQAAAVKLTAIITEMKRQAP